MTLGGAAQVAAALCLSEQTLDPAVCSYTDPPVPQPATLAFINYNSLSLPTEAWKAELT